MPHVCMSIYTYMCCNVSNLYIHDSVSLASLSRQSLKHIKLFLVLNQCFSKKTGIKV